MVRCRVGEVGIELKILGAGIRNGLMPQYSLPLNEFSELPGGRIERDDLNAFRGVGWEFLPSTDLDWKYVQAHNESRIEPGLLALYPLGGLVILRDRLVLCLRDSLLPEMVERYTARYSHVWELGFGSRHFEVQMELPERDLEGAIRRELEFLAASEDVVYAEPSLIYHVCPHGSVRGHLNEFDQWQWRKIDLLDAWKSTKGKGRYVAVVDLGFFGDREICHNMAWTVRLNEEGDLLYDQPILPSSHGTFCAGLIGARDDREGVHGVSPECELILVALPIEGVFSQVALGKALELCARGLPSQPGADVISCSLGLPEKNWILSCGLRDAIEFVLREGRPSDSHKRGTPIVWAVFDSDEEILSCSVEGYRRLISVSQCGLGDYRIDSGYGPALDLLAPGYEVIGISWDGGVRGIGSGEGSSLAAPCVAGVAALILAINPDLTWEQVAEVVTRSCDPVGPKKVPNDDVGWGRLNARKAVEMARQM